MVVDIVPGAGLKQAVSVSGVHVFSGQVREFRGESHCESVGSMSAVKDLTDLEDICKLAIQY